MKSGRNGSAGLGERRAVLDAITEKVIGCAHAVSNALGSGFLEKVYENALALELRQAGLEVEQQRRIEVRSREEVVGDFVADLVVAGDVMVEVKSVRALDGIHVAQCLNYLKATGCPVCLLLNFGTPRITVKRVVQGF